jgi:hypothetical protein
MIKEENDNFILIPSDIGENLEESEYSLRIMRIMIELPPSEFSEEY